MSRFVPLLAAFLLTPGACAGEPPVAPPVASGPSVGGVPAAPSVGAASSPAPSVPSVGAAPSAARSGPSVGAAPSAGSPAPHRAEVLVGATFEATLPSNPTTGYRWQVVEPLDPHLQLVSSAFEASPPPSGGVPIAGERELGGGEPVGRQAGGVPIAGRGGVEKFTFKAVSVGQAVVVFAYKRAWEKQSDRTESWEVTIK